MTITRITREQWLNARRETIGASDAAVILGRYPWQTPRQWYHRRLAPRLPDETTERQAIGHAAEPMLLDIASSREGWLLLDPSNEQDRAQILAQLPTDRVGIVAESSTGDQLWLRYGKLSATIDGWAVIDGALHTVEVKTVGIHSRPKWRDESGNPVIPPYVQDQMRHQLIVSGLSAGYAVALHGDFSVDVIRYEIEETSEHLSRVLDMARRVEEQDEPTPTGADLADVLAGSEMSDAPAELDDPDVVGLTLELSNLDKRISRLNQEIKPLDARRRELKAQIAVAVADLGGRAVCDGREWYVSETAARTVERAATRQLRSRKWKGGAL